jgi:hypothetical protein
VNRDVELTVELHPTRSSEAHHVALMTVTTPLRELLLPIPLDGTSHLCKPDLTDSVMFCSFLCPSQRGRVSLMVVASNMGAMESGTRNGPSKVVLV